MPVRSSKRVSTVVSTFEENSTSFSSTPLSVKKRIYLRHLQLSPVALKLENKSPQWSSSTDNIFKTNKHSLLVKTQRSTGIVWRQEKGGEQTRDAVHYLSPGKKSISSHGMNSSRESPVYLHSQNGSIQSRKVLKSKLGASRKVTTVKRAGKGKTNKRKHTKLTAANILLTDIAPFIHQVNFSNNRIMKRGSIEKFVKQKSVSANRNPPRNKIDMNSPGRASRSNYSSIRVVDNINNGGAGKQIMAAKFLHIQKNGKRSVRKISAESLGVRSGLERSKVSGNNAAIFPPVVESSKKSVQKIKTQVEALSRVNTATASKKTVKKGKNNIRMPKQIKSRSARKSHVAQKISAKQINKFSPSRTLRHAKVAGKDYSLSGEDTAIGSPEVQKFTIVKDKAKTTEAPHQRKCKTKSKGIRHVTQKHSSGRTPRQIKPARKSQNENIQTPSTHFKKSSRKSVILQTVSPVKSVTKKSEHAKRFLGYSVADVEKILDFIGSDNLENIKKSLSTKRTRAGRDAGLLTSPKRGKSKKKMLASPAKLSPAKSTSKSKSPQALQYLNKTRVMKNPEPVTVYKLDNLKKSPSRGRNVRGKSQLSPGKKPRQASNLANKAKRLLSSRNKKSQSAAWKFNLTLPAARRNKKKIAVDENQTAFLSALDIPTTVLKRPQSVAAEASSSNRLMISQSPLLKKDLKSSSTRKGKSFIHLSKTTSKHSIARKKRKSASKSQLRKIFKRSLRSEKQNSFSLATGVSPKQSVARILQKSVILSPDIVSQILPARKKTGLPQSKKYPKKMGVLRQRKSSILSLPHAGNVSSHSFVSNRTRIAESLSQVTVPESVLGTNRGSSSSARKDVSKLLTLQGQKSSVTPPKKETSKLSVTAKVNTSSSPATNNVIGLSLSDDEKNLRLKKNVGISSTTNSKKSLSLMHEISPKHSTRKKKSGLVTSVKRKTSSSSKFLVKSNSPRPSPRLQGKKSVPSVQAVTVEKKSKKEHKRPQSDPNEPPPSKRLRLSDSTSPRKELKLSPVRKGIHRVSTVQKQKNLPTSPAKSKHSLVLKVKKALSSSTNEIILRKLFSPKLKRTRLVRAAKIEKIGLVYPGQKGSSKSLPAGKQRQKIASPGSPEKATSQGRKKSIKHTPDKIFSPKNRIKSKVGVRIFVSPTTKRSRIGRASKIDKFSLISPAQEEAAETLLGRKQKQEIRSLASPKKATSPGKEKSTSETTDKIFSHKKSLTFSAQKETRKSLSLTPKMSGLNKASEIEISSLVSPRQKEVSKLSQVRNQMQEIISLSSLKKEVSHRKKKTAKLPAGKIFLKLKSQKLSAQTGVRKSFSPTPKRSRLERAAKIEKMSLVSPRQKEASQPSLGRNNMNNNKSTSSRKLFAKIEARRSLSLTPRKIILDKAAECGKASLVSQKKVLKLSQVRNHMQQAFSPALLKEAVSAKNNKTARLLPDKVFFKLKSQKLSTQVEVRKPFSPTSKRTRLERTAKIETNNLVSPGQKEASKPLQAKKQMQDSAMSASQGNLKLSASQGNLKPGQIFVNKKSPSLLTKIKTRKPLSLTRRTRSGEASAIEKFSLISPGHKRPPKASLGKSKIKNNRSSASQKLTIEGRKSLPLTPRKTVLDKAVELKKVSLVSQKEASKPLPVRNQMQEAMSSTSPVKPFSSRKMKTDELTPDKIFAYLKNQPLSAQVGVLKYFSPAPQRTRMVRDSEIEMISWVSPRQKETLKPLHHGNKILKKRSSASPNKTFSPRKKREAKLKPSKVLSNKVSPNLLSKTKSTPTRIRLGKTSEVEVSLVSSGQKEASKPSLGRKKKQKTRISVSPKKAVSPRKKTAKLTTGRVLSDMVSPKLPTKIGATPTPRRISLGKTEIEISLVTPGQKQTSKPSLGRKKKQKTRISVSPNKAVSPRKKMAKLTTGKILSNKVSPELLTNIEATSRRTRLNKTSDLEVSLVSAGWKGKPSLDRNTVQKTRFSVSPKKEVFPRKRTAKVATNKTLSSKVSPKLSAKILAKKSISSTTRRIRLDEISDLEVSLVSAGLKAKRSLNNRNKIQKTKFTVSQNKAVFPRKKTVKLVANKILSKKLSPNLSTKVEATRRTRLDKTSHSEVIFVSAGQVKASKPSLVRNKMQKTRISVSPNKAFSPRKKTSKLVTGKTRSSKASAKLPTKIASRKSLSSTPRTTLDKTSQTEVSVVSAEQKAKPSLDKSKMQKTRIFVSPKKAVSPGKRTAKLVTGKTLSKKVSPKLLTKIEATSPTRNTRLGKTSEIEVSLVSAGQKKASKPLLARNKMQKTRISVSPKKAVSPRKKTSKLVTGKTRSSKASAKLPTKTAARKSLSSTQRRIRLAKTSEIEISVVTAGQKAKPPLDRNKMQKTRISVSSKKAVSPRKKMAKLVTGKSTKLPAKIEARKSVSPTPKRIVLNKAAEIERKNLIPQVQKKTSNQLEVRNRKKKTVHTASPKKIGKKSLSAALKRTIGIELAEEAINVSVKKTGQAYTPNRFLELTQSRRYISTVSPVQLITKRASHKTEALSLMQRKTETPSKIINKIYAKQAKTTRRSPREIAEASPTRSELIYSEFCRKSLPSSQIKGPVYSQAERTYEWNVIMPSSAKMAGSSQTRQGKISPSPGQDRVASSLTEKSTTLSEVWTKEVSYTEQSRNVQAAKVAATSPVRIADDYSRSTINTPSPIQTKSDISSTPLSTTRNRGQDRKKISSKQLFSDRQHLATNVRSSRPIRSSDFTPNNDSEQFNVADLYTKERSGVEAEEEKLDIYEEVKEIEEIEESSLYKDAYAKEEGRYGSSTTPRRSANSQHCTVS